MERIKKRNLKRTRKHIAEVNGSMINMDNYRFDDSGRYNPECGSIGCIVGHATVLDAKNVIKNFTNKKGIKFSLWSEEFFGIYRESYLWNYLFGYNNPDIKDYHLYRMDYIIAGNEAPNIRETVYYNYNYIRHYDDGYFITKGLEL